MLDLNEEKNIFGQGYKLVAGIDEAGRGPLAGPVVAACVVLKPEFVISEKLKFVKDSKKLSAKKREELYNIIINEFSEIGVGICDQEIIDRINILQATFLAMKKSLGALRQKPDFILVDGGFKIPNMSCNQKNIIKGDELIFSIAAASIIAKVTRDRIMVEMHKKYPEYGFDKHKGYGTKFHIEQIKKIGHCLIHRKSFKSVKN